MDKKILEGMTCPHCGGQLEYIDADSQGSHTAACFSCGFRAHRDNVEGYFLYEEVSVATEVPRELVVFFRYCPICGQELEEVPSISGNGYRTFDSYECPKLHFGFHSDMEEREGKVLENAIMHRLLQ